MASLAPQHEMIDCSIGAVRAWLCGCASTILASDKIALTPVTQIMLHRSKDKPHDLVVQRRHTLSSLKARNNCHCQVQQPVANPQTQPRGCQEKLSPTNKSYNLSLATGQVPSSVHAPSRLSLTTFIAFGPLARIRHACIRSR